MNTLKILIAIDEALETIEDVLNMIVKTATEAAGF
jgi:hypothetical protein